MKEKKSSFLAIDLTFLAMMTAACVVGRFAFQVIPNFQPMTSMFLLFTLYFGLFRGLIICVLSVVISNFYFGMGPWTIQQILSFACVILIMAALCKIKFFRQSVFLQVVFAIIAGYLYGFIISIMQVYLYHMPNFFVYYLQGVSFDSLHAVGNGVFYLLLAPIFKVIFTRQIEKMEQIKRYRSKR